jgi:cystathionine beta-lyase/cystathionine gamma-synthase
MKKPNDVRREALALETLAVHAGREDFGEIGVHAPPIDLSTTYPTGDLAEATSSIDSLGKGGEPTGSFVYARFFNPTVGRYEKALAALEGAEASVAFASGMAALTAVLLAAREKARNHVVAVRPLYGGSDALLAGGLLGHEVAFTTPDGIAAAIRPDTCLVVLETPGNPTLDLVDIAQAVKDAAGVPVVVDSTFMTPVLQRPLEHGATLVLHSATKFLGGHGDVIAGVVATSEEWAARLRRVRVSTGALLHPMAAFLLHRGLPTLPVRVKAAQDGARMIAERLARHRHVTKVHFPGLAGRDPQGLLGRQMAGPGSVLSFEVDGGFEAARGVLGRVQLIVSAVSLGSTDTLIQHPAGLTHRCMSDAAKTSSGISASLLRLSVGLENPEDLWRDLEQALEAAHASRRASLSIAGMAVASR